MTIYDKMQSVASKLLKKYDMGEMIYRYPQDSQPSSPDPNIAGNIQLIMKGVARGVSKKYIDQGLAVAGDYQSTHPVDLFAIIPGGPRPGHYMYVNDIEYPIKQVLAIPPVGTPVVYRFIYGKS